MKRTSPWLLPAALLLAGCPSPAPIEDAGDNDASVMDAMVGMDAARDTGVRTDSAAACPTGQSTCSGRCVDTRSDRANCGACGMACAAGLVCTNGTCATNCATGQTDCSGRCIDAATDNSNCGACGTTCAAGQVCSMGRCSLTCAAGLLTCSGGGADGGEADGSDASGARYCANGASDNVNCGACGAVCPAGTACNAGRCESSCGAGQTLCGAACRDLQSDNNHCGACGTTCAAGQVCSMGACAASCGAGTVNCAGDCVRTASDPNHCGGCGMACALANVSVQACASSMCVVGACNAGFGDCDGNAPNGCETNVRGSDVNNCGACNLRCSFANAAATCSTGACVMGACNPGFADCDGNAANGCEVNLGADGANCGACGTVCAAGRSCSAGSCVTSCGMGQSICSGACVNTANDPANCGACGTSCPAVTNATSVCASSACRFVCDSTFADCDRAAANGCEVNTANSVTNCGTCGRVCAAGANQNATCTAGVCAAVCAPGFADCDGNAANGCEVNTNSSLSNCGGCGVACAASQTCFAGVCRTYGTTGLTATPMGSFRNACTTMGNTVVATAGDDVVTLGSIGFSLPFYGTAFTQFQADTNGNVLLGSTGSSSLSNSCALSSSSKTNILAVLWDDMNLGRTGAVGQHRICSVTTGSAPSRELLITYEEVPYFASGTPVTSHATYSLIVRESDGAITYQYALNALNASATVGIRGNTAAQTTVPMTPACNTAATLDGQQLSFTLTP